MNKFDQGVCLLQNPLKCKNEDPPPPQKNITWKQLDTAKEPKSLGVLQSGKQVDWCPF